jgi:DNA-binding response OmpR family regulator
VVDDRYAYTKVESKVECDQGNHLEPPTLKNSRRIMVLEGDDSVRELVRRWLVDAGHSVEAHAGPIRIGDVDLIIADVASPRAAGPLLAALRQPGTGAPVLLLSARFRTGQAGSAQLASELGVAGVLPKPFTQRQLLDAVTRALS